MVMVIHGDQYTEEPRANGVEDRLWFPADRLEEVTGWALKPEGFCRDDTCVPIPAGERDRFVAGDSVNVAALWTLLDRPALHTAGGDVWLLGEGAGERSRQLASLMAPDFRLPDLQGRMHALSDQRGRKVLLATWASW